MSEISALHLVWGPLGPAPLERFLAGYRSMPAGRNHELVIVFNGVENAAMRAELDAALDGVEHVALETPAPVIDLNAYRWAIDRLDGDRVVFLNSYSRLLAEGWLDLLARHLDDPGVGMAGATGTWESIRETPFKWKMPWTRLFPRFPNAHLRTTGFMLDRELAKSIRWRPPTGKITALGVESGRRSLSNEVKRQGLRLVVAGRDGRAFAETEWNTSGTYRTGEQENLIVADNRTDDYIAAGPAERARLSRLAWGDAG